MERKKTAVECLIEQLNTISWTLYCPKEVLDKLIADAKEMEKEQTISAYDYCRCIGRFENGTSYYNDTFNKTENNKKK